MFADSRAKAFRRLGERRLISFIRRVCSAEPKRCEHDNHGGDPVMRFAGKLLTAGGGIASLEFYDQSISLPYLVFIEPEEIRLRMMRDSDTYKACSPPSRAELADARRKLDDFAVIERKEGRFVARTATAKELDDLSYLIVATEGHGRAVGAPVPGEVPGTQCLIGSEPNATVVEKRSALIARMNKSNRERSSSEKVAAQRDYLEFLGYPGPINVCEDGQYAWTGSYHSFVLRDFASNLEDLGQPKEAEAALRRANPGGGACGVGVNSRKKKQIAGVIRSGERSLGCRRVVAERLLAVDEKYGPDRLEKAGFDVARLYRGALVARNRETSKDELKAILSRAPLSLRGKALKRLQSNGNEAWEERVLALEGVADSAQRASLPILLGVLPSLSEWGRVRALDALGRVASRRYAGACPKKSMLWGSWSNDKRRIEPFGRTCSTRLSESEAKNLSADIAKWTHDSSPEVREAAVRALGAVASDSSRKRLQDLMKTDPYVSGLSCSFCDHIYEVRMAAAEALVSIEEALAAGRGEEAKFSWPELDDFRAPQ